MPFILIVIGLCTLAATWASDADGRRWEHRQTNSDSAIPAKRAHHAMAFDPLRGEVTLYGGSTAAANDASTFFDDLWSWNGKRWSRIAVTGLPRASHRLLYDSTRRQLLLLGGFAGQEPYGDIRAFDGQRWSLLNDAPALATRLADAAVTYDRRRERIVLFGGMKPDKTVSGETWEFDGERWSQVSATGPGPLHSAAMIYDEARGVTLLVGGRNDKRAFNTDTWQWDGTTWRQVSSSGPTPRVAAGFVYDIKRNEAVLFGGLGSSGMLADTWLWDGTNWRPATAAGPRGRALSAMAYDQRRSVVVLFGGRIKYPEDSNETWEWDGKQWVEIRAR
jgi:hypothetical protein